MVNWGSFVLKKKQQNDVHRSNPTKRAFSIHEVIIKWWRSLKRAK